MNLQETLFADYKQAMMDKNTTKKTILNYVIAQVKNKKIEIQKEVEDADVVKILKKEVKAIAEAIWFLEKAENKEEDLKEEKAKKVLLEFYLPQTKSKDETREIIKNLISSEKITDLKTQRWKLMGAIMWKHGWNIEWSLVNEIINEMLSEAL